MTNKEPRPYVVSYKTTSGGIYYKHVIAYDLMEAAMQASMMISADGVKDAKVVDAAPDMEALEAEVEARRLGAAAEYASRIVGAMTRKE